jgi:hypothetical protein
MAGFIHIKGQKGLSVGSVAFNALAEFTRPFFKAEDQRLVKEIYLPLDEGGLDMVSLDEQGVEGFNAYYRGIRSAYEECKSKKSCGALGSQYFDMVMKSFDELINLLEEDERFRA